MSTSGGEGERGEGKGLYWKAGVFTYCSQMNGRSLNTWSCKVKKTRLRCLALVFTTLCLLKLYCVMSIRPILCPGVLSRCVVQVCVRCVLGVC